MRYGYNRTFILLKMTFKPCNGFRIKVVRRFVQKQNIRLLQKQAAKSHTAALTAGKYVNNLVRRRTAQCVHCKFKLGIKIPCVKRVELFLYFSLAGAKFVKICVRVAECFVNFVEFLKKRNCFCRTLFDNLHYGFSGCKFRFLRQIADCIARQN